jgi:succinate dehydrogenase / fumarate reductase membrane anchor subunit
MPGRGTSAFIALRMTAVLLLPLTAWALWSLRGLAGTDYETARAWAGEPANAIFAALFILVAAWHMALGLSEVIEDYIHGGLRGPLLALNGCAAAAIALAGGVAAYLLAFAG